MNHLVLLGDSILDNAPYTAGGPAVISHLQSKLPAHWKASLLAGDGSMTEQVIQQLSKIPDDTTHLVVSAGGNNAIMQSGFLSEPTQSVPDVLHRMASISQQFAQEYHVMLSAIRSRNLPTMLCTIYDPNFADPAVQQLMRTGLVLFNEVILRAAIQAGLPVLDLRLVCQTPEDYANEIEPSVLGGAKIAEAIIRSTTLHDFSTQRTTIYA